MEVIQGNDQNRWAGEPLFHQYSFEAPTDPDAMPPSYAHLRPELLTEDIIFAGRHPFEMMGEIGTDLANDETITAEEIALDLQMACGVHLNDKNMHVMLGWATEEIRRQALYRDYVPDRPPKAVIMQKLYGIEIKHPIVTPIQETA